MRLSPLPFTAVLRLGVAHGIVASLGLTLARWATDEPHFPAVGAPRPVRLRSRHRLGRWRSRIRMGSGARMKSSSAAGRRPRSIARRWLRSLTGLACGLAACLACSEPRRADVVVVSVDTLSRHELARAGSLPVLDALAEESLVFSNAHSSAPWTLPAHASMFTGLYPDRHGALHDHNRLSEHVPTLARSLAAVGYVTGFFGDGGYLDPAFGLLEGFSVYDELATPEARELVGDLPRSGAPSAVKGAALFDRAISFVDALSSRDGPFLLFLHTFSVHDYHRLHPWTADVLPEGVEPEHDYISCLRGRRACEVSEQDELRALYQAELRHLDAGLGRLLKALGRSEREAGTLFVLLSDHGEGFDFSRQRIHHGGRVQEDQIRIPMFIRGPGIQPRTSDETVSVVDLMPTVLDWLGLPVPGELDGTSLAPLLRGEESTEQDRVVYAMEHYQLWRDGERLAVAEPRAVPLSLAVIRGRDWYIRHPAGEQLYDMEADPTQTQNLAGTSPTLPVLRARAQARVRAYRPPNLTRRFELRTDEQLRALGYLD